jgi:hypothetical protein
MPQCRNAAMPQCRNAAMPQCRNAAMPQCRNAAMPQSVSVSFLGWGKRDWMSFDNSIVLRLYQLFTLLAF